MSLVISTKNNSSGIYHTPLGNKDKAYIREMIVAGTVCYIAADGQEGMACINAYKRMAGVPVNSLTSAINYQVCYAGDLANSILLNLIRT